MKPLILLDFDRTLFKTEDYWQDFALALARASGQPDGYFMSAYDSFLQGEGRLQMVNYDQILAVTGVSEQHIADELARIAAGKSYLYNDGLRLLEDLQKIPEYEVEIVTFGDDRYQSLKIGLVPEIQNLPINIIQSLKNRFIEAKYVGRRGMLVDDKPEQNLPTGWAEITLNKQANRQNPVNISDGIYEISTLDDVLKFKFDHEKGFLYV